MVTIVIKAQTVEILIESSDSNLGSAEAPIPLPPAVPMTWF